METLKLKYKNDNGMWVEKLCTTQSLVKRILEDFSNKIGLSLDGKQIEERCGGSYITLTANHISADIFLGIPMTANKEVTIIKENSSYSYLNCEFYDYLQSIIT